MKTIEVKKYDANLKESWDSFVDKAKNATFLFRRDFMDYHKHRFEDYSLMVFEGKKLMAVLPANVVGNSVFSHQGLSYGGLVLHREVYFSQVVDIFRAVLLFLENDRKENLHLKLLPHIYHKVPSEEIEYLLFILKAKLERCDTAAVIDYRHRLEIKSSNRLRGIKKAIKNKLQIKEEVNFEDFWSEVLIPNLKRAHRASPVHTVEEIDKLRKNFPENIRQFNVYSGTEILGGTTIFETNEVAHVQYISATEAGRNMGALDLLYEVLIDNFSQKKYFTFGISNEDQGQKVNKGLLHWKETFGARTVTHSFYKVETKNHPLLNVIYV